MKITLHLFFIFSSFYVYSQNRDTLLLPKVINELQLNEANIHYGLVVDKILPYSEDKTVFVIPVQTNVDEESNDYFEFDAYIVIADNKNRKIINKFHEPDAWVSDVVILESIEIDTGLYILNEETRAFGIRLNYSGSSRVNPYYETKLSLFILQDNKLKKILEDLSVYYYNGEWDMNCAGEFQTIKSHILMDKEISANFKNLIIKTEITETSIFDCIEKEKEIFKRSEKIKYNGEIYLVL